MLHAADGLIAHVTDVIRLAATVMMQGAAMVLLIIAVMVMVAFAAGAVTAVWKIVKDQRKKKGRRMP